MKLAKTLTLIVGLGALLIASPASAQDERWAFPREGDFRLCVSSNKNACHRLYVGYWLWPRLEELLREALPAAPVIIVPRPQPDPPPFAGTGALGNFLRHRDLAGALIGDPAPQPNINVPIETRIEATRQMRDGLSKVVDQLGKDLETLEENESQ